jgi:pilus assembly protein CpaF
MEGIFCIMQPPLATNVSSSQQNNISSNDSVSVAKKPYTSLRAKKYLLANSIVSEDSLGLVVHRLQEMIYSSLKNTLQQTKVTFSRHGYEPLSLVAHIRHAAFDILHTHMELTKQIHTVEEAEIVLQALLHGILGFGAIQPLLDDQTISDIYIFDLLHVTYTKCGKRELSLLKFMSNAQILMILRNVERWTEPHSRIHVDQGGSLSLESGIDITVAPAALWGKEPILHIHRNSARTQSLAELVKRKTISRDMQAFLQAAVEARLNIIVCGTAQSGRTTLLNALCQYIPAKERVITIEDVSELQLTRNSWLPLVVDDKRDTKPDITLKDILHEASDMVHDRIVVGECIGDEIAELLQIMHTEQSGTMTTFYAQHMHNIFPRMEMLCLVEENVRSLAELRVYLANAIQIIVFVSAFPDGVLRVQNIAEVENEDAEKVTLHSLYYYEETGFDLSTGIIQGIFRKTGFLPISLEVFTKLGIPFTW